MDDNPEGTCEDIIVVVEIYCDALNGLYNIAFSFAPSPTGSDYAVTNNQTGMTTEISDLYYIVGPNATGTGYSYTVFLVDDSSCNAIFERQMVDCTTTDVELLDFRGVVKGEGNALNWSTATEKGTDFYQLERSIDGAIFTPIANINARGNTNQTSTYQYLDKQVTTGIYFYRIREVNVEGRSKIISDAILLKRSDSRFAILTVAPIPARNFVNIDFSTVGKETVYYEIYDITGRQIANASLNTKEGLNQLQLNLNDYTFGTYFIKINSPKYGEMVTRFIKQ